MESHDAEFREGETDRREAKRIQREAFRVALNAIGVMLSDETFEVLSLPDIRSIYNCVAVNHERGFRQGD